VRNYPWYRGWHDDLAKKGLVVVGVHTPETAGEANLTRLRAKVKENRITYPIAVDNQARTWRAWDNRVWPGIYVVDRKGIVRYRWYGELNHGKVKAEPVLRKKIEQLLAEKE
jgi:hypothetical protein